MRLERIDKPDWADVERAFQRVKKKTGERWTLPFVFKRLAEGKAGLFRFVAEKHIAYMVCELYEQGEAPWMNVWILEGEGLERADECLPLIDGLARSIGAVAWRCTGRKGWKAIGLKPIATVYERAVI